MKIRPLAKPVAAAGAALLCCQAFAQAAPEAPRLVVTILAAALVPALLAVLTAFARIFVILLFLRAGIGDTNIPPTIVLLGLAVLLTWLAMHSTFQSLSAKVIVPLWQGKIAADAAAIRAKQILASYMASRADAADLAAIAAAAGYRPSPPNKAPFEVLAAAFALSELRTAFIAGLAIYLPFLVVDIVVGLALASLGPALLPHQAVALPAKILFFIAADGWRWLFAGLAK